MISSDFTRRLLVPESDSKIVLLVIDGLGGLPDPDTGRSELDSAMLPNLDRIARSGSCGSLTPLGPGFTPGSGPAHLALFGYDPWRWQIGRGALSALGTGMDFRPGDLAARLNFCSVDADGRVTDRRAGRISTDQCRHLCALLADIDLPGTEISLVPEMEYRAAIVFRGEGLSARLTESDPQQTGVAPRAVSAIDGAASRAEAAVTSFLSQAEKRLRDQSPANMVLIRGFGTIPEMPRFGEVYGLRGLAVAAYPMYRGVAQAVGMSAIPGGGDLSSSCELLRRHWDRHDFFFIHFKKTDSAGEDGDFGEKVRLLEEMDASVSRIQELEPEVFAITGDHSTPSLVKSHSWHPVPVAIASRWAQPHEGAAFSERGCRNGSIGSIPSSSLMALLLAHAARLRKYGA